jgi:hypothetical protein
MGSLRRVIDAPISIEAAKVLHVVATFVGAGRTIGNVIALSNSGGQIVNCNASNNSFTSSNNITSGSASDYFIDATASNFSLNAGSSARDAGIDVGLPFSGSAPDIGACEYGSNQTCPPGESSP